MTPQIKNYRQSFGKVHIPLNLSDVMACVGFIEDEEDLKNIYLHLSSAIPNNKRLMEEYCKVAHEYANKMGYQNWAEYKMSNSLIKSSEELHQLLHSSLQNLKPKMNEYANRLERYDCIP